jgi:nicotinamidase-related amidase
MAMPDLENVQQGLGTRPALMLVDLICGFTDPRSPLGSDADDVVAANQQLLGAFRTACLPVFYSTVVYRSDEQARVFRQRLPDLNILQPDSKWVQIDPRLAPTADECVVEKCHASVFHGTDLLSRLHEAGIDSMVVTGLTTSGCVRATAVDGLQHDFKVVVVREAVGDRNLQAHEANLHDLNAKYADVVSLESVLCQLKTLGVSA